MRIICCLHSADFVLPCIHCVWPEAVLIEICELSWKHYKPWMCQHQGINEKHNLTGNKRPSSENFGIRKQTFLENIHVFTRTGPWYLGCFVRVPFNFVILDHILSNTGFSFNLNQWRCEIAVPGEHVGTYDLFKYVWCCVSISYFCWLN